MRLANYRNHSGGAEGSDSEWDRIGRLYGVTNHTHYYHGKPTPLGNTPITDTQLAEGWGKVLKANEKLKRRPENYKSLLSRNWFQIKPSDNVFAIAEEIDFDKGIVAGGTGWAVQMAIDEGVPVYVFNQADNYWYAWGDNGFYQLENVPRIRYEHYTGIGTRGINDAGKLAIESVYLATLVALWGQDGRTINFPRESRLY